MNNDNFSLSTDVQKKSSIDPHTLVIPKTRVELADAASQDCGAPAGPEKGGKGGEGGMGVPPLPPLPASSAEQNLPRSNRTFLEQLFSSLGDDEHVAVCSKPGDPTAGPWLAVNGANVEKLCAGEANNYFNCSTFRLDPDGSLKARKDLMYRYRVLVFDDINTKVLPDRVQGLAPTYIIETSPSNFQYGFLLAEPINDPDVVVQLQLAVSAAGLSDAGAMGAARWVRLPFAINGKTKYRDDDGNPFVCKLTEWSPENRYSIDDIYRGFGLTEVTAVVAQAMQPVRYTPNTQAGLSHEVFRAQQLENPVITALKERGLYKVDKGHGRHEITCPWYLDHTDHIDTGGAYFEPSAAYPTGGFKCHHSHGEALGISNLLEKLDVEPRSARNRSEIRFEPGCIDQVVKACDYVLSQLGNAFQAGGVIVMLRETEGSNDVRMEPASIPELTMALAAACTFLAYNRKEKEWRPCDPPERVLRTLLGASRYTYLPNLRGIARQPYYRPGQGSLVTTAGYDAVSGIYGWFNEDEVKLGELTRDGAQLALTKLTELIDEFEFETPADCAATLSGVLTATVRPYLPVAPAFLTTAPESGVGKSYLNSVIVPFAGGEPARASFPLTADEANKSFLALLLSSPACIEYDDMVCNFKPHAILNRGLTSEIITDRILSVSKTATVSTRTFIIGSGINIAPERDMNRRVITIRLASRPADRISKNFAKDPAALMRERRMEMISHVLTIIEAWKAAGSPKSNVRPIASYNGEWSDYCRHPLIWLGLPDPAQSLFDQVEDDVDGELLGALLQEWHKTFGSTPFTVRRVVQLAFADTSSRLFELLDELPIKDGGKISNHKFGWYISLRAKRVVNGLRFVQGRSDGRPAWIVEKVVKAVPPSAGSPITPVLPLSPPLPVSARDID
ncbi:MAG: hypothetical protein HEQ34_13105 [Sphingorhabdus sp.]|uniref:DNA-primase RepB domain-containing protein n=1 Tax=Sphingorhabdus sp. TaxID=1902408 RepID=UPI0025D94FCF|nr:DNA-primase RepB domain-containing protein [Sphingorhabdus sp.]MCO4092871.1 hypothetical protein [Sphingorhabdus sp.]